MPGIRSGFDVLLDVAGESQVEDLEFSALGEADVLRLQVAMNDAVYVGKVEGSRQVVDDMQRFFERNPLPAANQLAQCFAFDVFEDGVRLVAVKAEIVNRRDAFVMQVRAELRLAFKERLKIFDAAPTVR